MYNTAIEILNIMQNNGFEGYIIGGYVRDKILGIESNDIDIATNATISDLSNMFDDIKYINFGSCKLEYLGFSYEVTTFRSDIGYNNSRWPEKIEYKKTLIEDLNRRDFTINTICINYKEEYIDYLNGIEDLNNKIIRSVGNPSIKLKNDSLRILRAIRFACLLNFKIDDSLYNAIKENSSLLNNLSFDRKKIELDRIFASSNALYGLKLLSILGLTKSLQIEDINNVKYTSNYLGIWSQIKYSDKYNFTRKEIKVINSIKNITKEKIVDKYTIYVYGLENNIIAGEILNISKENILDMYNNMCIHKRKDINIDLNSISYIPKNKINIIYIDLEKKILYNEIENKKETIIDYLNNNFKE